MNSPLITREQVLEASKGMLQKQFYVIFSKPTNGIEPVMENLPRHLKHQCQIERDGILVAAGPHWADDEKHWEGDGMFVIRATSLADANRLAALDPMHQCGARSFTIRPWLINEGSLNLHISFSDGRMVLE
ncbi:YciI family protein [Terriglobus saanensis]|uniref:YCII-related protein n=1 Tax=Terriglobus saanensis (strain ATCC BAA-1853 / DSM 23119 / SP1PR4) TaxID=401053 RepID=E8UZM7_TERSS|nr:YciI family protein [Terriglobus saanensis]ADV84370.1 YCII-related protein [Terriglobus saanensis SP1PR4]